MTRTIEDLRSTFAGRADDLTDAGLSGRSAAVATRVRRVRRQRRAALAGGLAAVLTVVGTGLALGPLQRHDRSLEPTAPLAGHAIPRTVEVAGFTYKLATATESKPGDRMLTLSLPKVDHDRVVSLAATGLGSGDATLFFGEPSDFVGLGKPAWYDGGSVLDRVATDSAVDRPVDVGAAATHLTVRLRNAGTAAVVGLAVYDQGDSLPEGVSAHGMVFPTTVGGEHLIAGAIGDPGDDSVSITFRGPVHHPDLEGLCATSEKDIFVHLTQTGTKGWLGRSCTPFDATGDVNLGVGHAEPIGDRDFGPGMHTVTLEVFRNTPHHPDTPVDLSDVRLALALYDDPAAVRLVDGMAVKTREFDGWRMWRLDQVVPYEEGRTRVDARSGLAMLEMVYTGRTNACPVAAGSDGSTYSFSCVTSEEPGPTATSGDLLMPGATYTLSTQEPNSRQPGRGLTHILIYRPVN